MAPSDREFERLISQIDAMNDKLDHLREEIAEYRGAAALMKWGAGGGFLGLLSGLAALWHTLRGG